MAEIKKALKAKHQLHAGNGHAGLKDEAGGDDEGRRRRGEEEGVLMRNPGASRSARSRQCTHLHCTAHSALCTPHAALCTPLSCLALRTAHSALRTLHSLTTRCNHGALHCRRDRRLQRL